MNLRKGISPVIATVIIVAVALAIAIAVVGWIMGIWGAVTGGTEMLKILPDSYINTTGYLVLHVRNEGGATASIYRIEVGSEGITSFSYLTTTALISTISTADLTSTGTSISVSAGADVYLYIKLSGSYTTSAIYTVKIYTTAGNVYTAQVQAK